MAPLALLPKQGTRRRGRLQACACGARWRTTVLGQGWCEAAARVRAGRSPGRPPASRQEAHQGRIWGWWESRFLSQQEHGTVHLALILLQGPKRSAAGPGAKSDTPFGTKAAVPVRAGRYSPPPGISGCSLWLSQCLGESHWRRSPADRAQGTKHFFFIKTILMKKKKRETLLRRPSESCAE